MAATNHYDKTEPDAMLMPQAPPGAEEGDEDERESEGEDDEADRGPERGEYDCGVSSPISSAPDPPPFLAAAAARLAQEHSVPELRE